MTYTLKISDDGEVSLMETDKNGKILTEHYHSGSISLILRQLADDIQEDSVYTPKENA